MAMHSARSKRVLIPVGASLAVLVVAASAYAVTGASPTRERTTVDTAAAGPTTAVTTAPAAPAKPSPSARPSSSKTTATPTPSGSPYLGRIGSATSTSPSAVDTMTVSPAPAGSTLVATVLLLGTASGTPRVTDTEGNSYQLQVNQADAAGDTLLLFTATSIRGLTQTDTVSISYPAASEHAVAIDEYTGHSAIDQSASATGYGTNTSTGKTTKTTTADEVAVTALADINGSATLSGYTKLPSLTVAGASVATAWRALTSTGSYSADGTSDGPWLAGLLTMR